MLIETNCFWCTRQCYKMENGDEFQVVFEFFNRILSVYRLKFKNYPSMRSFEVIEDLHMAASIKTFRNFCHPLDSFLSAVTNGPLGS